jgi:hypothetical protein
MELMREPIDLPSLQQPSEDFQWSWPEVPSSSFEKQQPSPPPPTASASTQHDGSADPRQAKSVPLIAKTAVIKTQVSNQLTLTPDSDAERPQTQRKPWQKLGRFMNLKASWPDPHLSIGTKCNRMGVNDCWEAVGPAKALYAEIAPRIGKLLDDRMDELEEGEPVAVDILTFGMYMVGKTPKVARPTLLFTCQRKNPRRRAIRFVEQSSILKGKPKITLAESAIVPTATNNNYLMLLARDPALQEMCEIRTPGLPTDILELVSPPSLPPPSSSSPSRSAASWEEGTGTARTDAAGFSQNLPLDTTIPLNIFGLPIISSSTGRKATIGGFLSIQGQYYGLTVAHVFDNLLGSDILSHSRPSSKQQDGDPEFAFHNTEDEVEDTDNSFHETDVVVTSQGTRT